MKKIFLISIIILLGLIGCGSDSSGGDTTVETKTGAFIDAPVEGLKYETPTLSGYTNGAGQFQYKTGENVKFSLGNLIFGSATGSNTMTPLTLTGENDLNNISSKATNIARILQTLDDNTSGSGLIKLSSSLRDLNVSNVDFESEASLNTILQKAQEKTSRTYTLKDSEASKTEMKNYLTAHKNFVKYPKLRNETYTDKDVLFYGLTMKNDGKIIFTKGSNANNIIIYDLDFNIIGNCTHLDANGYEIYANPYNKDLKAGNYIVKFSYRVNNPYTQKATIIASSIEMD